MQSGTGMPLDTAGRETVGLLKSIEEFNRQSSKQTQQMIYLTRVIAVLTVVMTILIGVQIYLAIVHCY